jgi:hypothetical protein
VLIPLTPREFGVKVVYKCEDTILTPNMCIITAVARVIGVVHAPGGSVDAARATPERRPTASSTVLVRE